ncbi:MAG TPA: hypothetical protein PK191_02605 [Niabella sp.]|nr:hypothetical protein [Niabella sp.]HOZ96783.1 hypothetical protein [Niabella sp.]HQW14740.1 hypothetical protein [Niabella sp.]HQX20008.1 hypothetical protein [Niabella sp.]HQX40628.1 hypothetical protein [Niabella sp.]
MEGLKKEQIKDRLVRLAAERWNVQESEVEANFDPMMLLLFDALASELEGVGHQIMSIQDHLLQELSALMLPQSILNAKPACCVISAPPNENSCTVNNQTDFITITQIQKSGEPVKEAEISFTPIGSFELLKLQLSHLMVGDKIFNYLPNGNKSLLHEKNAPEWVDQIHLIIQNQSGLTNLDGLQIFFDLKGHSEAGYFYDTLQQATLLVNGNPVQFRSGYANPSQFEITLKEALSGGGNYSRKIQKEVAGIFERQFISLLHAPVSEVGEDVPDYLQKVPENILKEINLPPTIYCTLQLARPFASDVLERIQIGINAFPVINRKMENVNFKTDRWINIIPLQVSGSFLDIESINGVEGSKYRLYENANDRDLKTGEAIVRVARVGKSSSAEIRNSIQGLLEAIRDESAYFSRISNDFISTRLAEISKILTRLEDQVELSKDEKPAFRYLLLKPQKVGESLRVSYWVTHPKSSSFVKAGQAFRAQGQTLTNSNFSFSLTAAAGGVDTRSDYQQKQMLVRQLSTRGKIVSAEDVKLLCYELFGNKLRSVDVCKTMRVMPSRQVGISRIIFIDIKVGAKQFSTEEINYLENLLRYQLSIQASFVFPYEISIEEI